MSLYWVFTLCCSEVPKDWREDFVSESSASKEKMHALKERIRTSGLEVYDG